MNTSKTAVRGGKVPAQTFEVCELRGNAWGKSVCGTFLSLDEAESYASDLNANAHSGYRYGVRRSSAPWSGSVSPVITAAEAYAPAPAPLFPPVMKVEVETSRHIQDKTGRAYLRFVPVATFAPLASGSLRFACFDAWEDDEANIMEQMERAVASCRGAVLMIAAEVGAAL